MKNILYIVLTLTIFACTKHEIEEVSGNQAPGEILVTQAMKDAYINRLYISLTGRKPTSAEFSLARKGLGNLAGTPARGVVIDQIFSKEDYTIRLYDIARGDYLESLDTALIRSDYQQVINALQTATGPAREYYLHAERVLKAMLEIPAGLLDETINITEMYRRVVDNIYYDDINMGSENYVVATFQNFLFRYPTNVELENGTNMVDGTPSSLFLKAGNSKQDFIDIFFDSDDYAEGLVINLYRKYLFREPTTTEMFIDTDLFIANGDYRELQKKILTSDEYFFN
ncbi:hypothetical protein [Owenweeksia hongkongensis]|nr:hypothetical protein [Owenweeksia hongkongensis]